MFFKRDFKPDKSGAGLRNKLHLTQQQRRSLLKWTLYGVMLLVLSLLQDVVLCRFRLFGATTELVPCGIILICVLEGAERGSVFTLVASVLYLFSGTAAGPYSVVFLTFLAIGVTVLRQAYLQKGFFAALICTAVAMIGYEMLNFGIGLFLSLTIPGRAWGFLLTALLSLLAVPALYPISLTIGKIGGHIWNE